jgi:hypothetical protein
MRIAGDNVTIAVENGAAVYVKTGETEGGDWICRLEPNSSYTPAPVPYDPKNASLELSEEFKAEAAAEANRKSAEAARLRLAILSA